MHATHTKTCREHKPSPCGSTTHLSEKSSASTPSCLWKVDVDVVVFRIDGFLHKRLQVKLPVDLNGVFCFNHRAYDSNRQCHLFCRLTPFPLKHKGSEGLKSQCLNKWWLCISFGIYIALHHLFPPTQSMTVYDKSMRYVVSMISF